MRIALITLALVAALAASEAKATIVDATTDVGYSAITGPANWYTDLYGQPPFFSDVQIINGSNSQTAFRPTTGVFGTHLTFSYDTSFGTLSADGKTLTWSGVGPSPFLGGTLSIPVAQVSLDLSGATSFSIQRYAITNPISQDGPFTLSVAGLGYNIGIGPWGLITGPSALTLTDPSAFTLFGLLGGHSNFSVDPWSGSGDVELFGQSLTPQPVPEPASWALMLAGVGLMGAMLRQRRRQVLSAT